METLLIFLEINLILSVVYLSFRFLLRDLSFHHLNRFFLLVFSLIAIILPFLDLNFLFLKDRIDNQLIYTYSINLPELIISNKKQISTHNYLNDFFKIYFSFSILILVVKSINLIKFIKNNPQKIALINGSFSFLGKIYLNQEEKESEFIVNHEMVHKKEYHFVDLIFFELLQIVFWANPFVYKLSKEIKIVHEFLADSISVSKIQDKQKYIKLLLDSRFKTDTSFLFVQHFHNQSILKLRIIMLLKQRSRQIQLVRYALLSPILVIGIVYLLIACKEKDDFDIKNSKSESLNTSKEKSIVDSSEIGTKIPTVTVSKLSQIKEINNFDENLNHTKETTKNLNKAIDKTEDEIFTVAEEAPEFPGGITEMYKYLGNNIKYPQEAQRANITGKVYVKFVVEKDGSIGETTVMKGIGYGCDQEAVRVLKSMPKWKPGVQNGKSVRVYYHMPVVYTLE